MTTGVHLMIAELVRRMRQAHADKPGSGARGLVDTGIAAMRADETSPFHRTHFGEKAQVFGVLEALADAVMAGKPLAATHPDRAKGLPADTLVVYEEALACDLPEAKKPARRKAGG